MGKKQKKKEKPQEDKPVSLYPLEPEEAIKALLQVKPQKKNKNIKNNGKD